MTNLLKYSIDKAMGYSNFKCLLTEKSTAFLAVLLIEALPATICTEKQQEFPHSPMLSHNGFSNTIHVPFHCLQSCSMKLISPSTVKPRYLELGYLEFCET